MDVLRFKIRRVSFRVGMFLLIAIALLAPYTPAYAISTPDSTPTVVKINIWRNVLETGDTAIFVYENTPYATTPTDYNYSDAFVWRLIDTDGTTELAQATGYNYNERGYGYNVISFYFDAASAPAWEGLYTIRLSGTPAAFTSPPQYSFSVVTADYSSLTATADVKLDIAARILEIAADLDNQWGLSTTYSLLSETEASTTLSIYGQAFFRGAIYGVQAMAPSVFSINITDISTTDRTWASTYVTALSNQYTGTYIGEAFDSGKGFFDVDYNLMGTLILLVIMAGIVFLHWRVGGGNIWRGLIESCPPVVIASRIGLFGLGEIALVAAIGWLYISAKVWKLI